MLKLTSSRERRQELKKPYRKNDHCIFPPLTPRGYGFEQWALENMLKNIAPVIPAARTRLKGKSEKTKAAWPEE